MNSTHRTIPAVYYPSEEVSKNNLLSENEISNYATITFLMFQKTNIHFGYVQDIRFNKIKESVIEIMLKIREWEKGNTQNIHPNFSEMYRLFLDAGNMNENKADFLKSLRLAELYYNLISYERRLEDHKKELSATKIEGLYKLISNKADTFRAVSDSIILDLIELSENEEPSYYYDQEKKVGLLIDLLNDIKEKLSVGAEVIEINETISFEEEKIKEIQNEIEQWEGKIKAA